MATAVHDGRFWLAGGLDPDGSASNEVRVFDAASGDWTDGPSLPAAVHHASLVSDGTRLLMGGYAAPGFGPTDAVWLLSDGADAWTAGPPLPEPRGAGAAAWDGTRALYGGGLGQLGVRDEIFAFDGEAWSSVAGLSQAREHLGAASDGAGRTWFLGGRLGGIDTNLGTVDLVEGAAVAAIGELSPRGGVAAFLVPGIGACLTGGEAPLRALTLVECMDAGGRITALPEMTQTRHGHGAGVVDGVAWVLLGGPTPGLSAQSSVERLTLPRDGPR